MTYIRKHADSLHDAGYGRRNGPVGGDLDTECPTRAEDASGVEWLLDAYIAGMLPVGRGARLSWWPEDQSKQQRTPRSGFADRLDQAWAEA
jgi:hypothetical protein